MLVQLIVVVVLLVVTGLYVKWVQVRSYWKRRNVPYEPPHPFYGSLTFLQKINVGPWMVELYKKFKAPYVGIWLFWTPALVINDPEIARRVLIKDFDSFRDRYLGSGKSDPIGGLNIFTVNDPVWSSVRRKMTPVFSSAKLKVYTSLMRTKAKDLSVRIQREMDQGGKFDLRHVLTDYTTDIVGSAAFGIQSDATLTGDSAMRRITRDFQTYSFMRSIAHTCIFFLPAVTDILRLSFFPKETTDYFRKIWRTVVEQRGGYGKALHEKKDLVDTLIKLKHDDDKEMTEDIIIAQAAVMLQGGFETSGTALTFALYELAFLPEAQKKLYQELKEIKQNLNGEDFTMDVLSEANYLNAVIKETIRKYHPMGWLDRIASKPYEIDERLTIPAGTPIYVNAIGMQLDEKYFPDPTRFDPDRFLPENEKLIQPYTYLPFGDGPRNCIGSRFAQQTMRFGLAGLMSRFELRPLPGAPTPNEVSFDKRAMFLMPGQTLHVDFVPRTSIE